MRAGFFQNHERLLGANNAQLDEKVLYLKWRPRVLPYLWYLFYYSSLKNTSIPIEDGRSLDTTVGKNIFKKTDR